MDGGQEPPGQNGPYGFGETGTLQESCGAPPTKAGKAWLALFHGRTTIPRLPRDKLPCDRLSSGQLDYEHLDGVLLTPYMLPWTHKREYDHLGQLSSIDSALFEFSHILSHKISSCLAILSSRSSTARLSLPEFACLTSAAILVKSSPSRSILTGTKQRPGLMRGSTAMVLYSFT